MEHPAVLFPIMMQNYLMSWFVAGYVFRFPFGNKHIQFALWGGLLVYVTRSVLVSLGWPMGINTLITSVLSIPIFKAIFKIDNWKEPALMSIFAYMMVIFVEILTVGYSLQLFNSTPDVILKTPSLHFKFIILQNTWIFLFISLIRGCHVFYKKLKGENI